MSDLNPKKNLSVDLTQGSIHKHLIRMALPMMIGIAASMGFILADTFFIGMLGPDELAAIGFVGPIAMVIVAASIGLGAGTSSVLARAVGSGDQQAMVKLATNSFILAVLISLIFTLIGLLTIDPLFTMMGADENTLPLIRDYMLIWYWSPLFIIIPMVAMGVIRAMGDTSLQGKIMILAALANVILDPIMIFGLFGFPRLELAGAAYATLITRAGSFIAVMYYLIYRFHVINFSTEILNSFKTSISKIMNVGIPAMGTNMIIPIAGGAVIAIIATFGNEAVAGTNVAMRMEAVFIIVFYALSAVIGPFVGQNLGAGKHDRVEKALQQCALFALIWGVFLAAAIAVIAPVITRQFSDVIAIQDYANDYLYIMPISYGAYGFVMIANATFNGIGHPIPGVIVSSLRVALFQFPLVLVAAFIFDDMQYVYAASSFSNLLAGIIAYIWVMRSVRDMALKAPS
ncbi:Multi antimicrobial extrusion protein (Na(+)/drug antiporter), MATE family of MDR efflux pumps [hydrothermal vent metagenome]|uniref:Multi antimicrobial extrusion protein (Na(+)/drug antiporter), MATE family of MDR efflux pumps n=1 Tax=hydrothermal vent metagenome TaxID=652676 RepID=A0A3B1B5H0_9ZZZZ